MLWLYLVIIAHLLNAVVFIMDKYYISGPIPEKTVYAFYESAGSLFWLPLVFFGVFILSPSQMALTLAAGFLFSLALVFFYDAVKKYNISRAAPIVGALTAVFTLALSLKFLSEKFKTADFYAFAILVMGTFAAANISLHTDGHKKIIKELTSEIISSLLFALSYVMTKIAFNELGFINTFFWTRMGMVVGAAFIFVFLNRDNVITRSFKESGHSLKFGFFATKLLAGVAFLLVAIAISLGNVSLVNALQGLQYVFLILVSFAISERLPHWKLIKEKYARHDMAHKISTTILIVTGLVLLGWFNR